MQQVANGNLDMLKVLFERHHVHVYNFLYKMSRDRMLSEDLTQDVFYKLMRYRKSYNNGNFVSWMFTIARNSLNTHFRRNKENNENIDTVEFRLANMPEEKEEAYSHLHMALEKLEASDRELVIMNRFQGIRYAELAHIVGSTEGAVKTKVNRALKKLKTIYFENV
ncbi:sigma-70 family RNA polymerase sigma factor [Flavobacteriaceae bacterium TP-CH-4]|uniref:Sigma-70 family RNA polymerase sigma factor n=1 Tax=Pelagihabitans pacificus TaxID=2696054 RepID=A0A967AUV8_9FLAO|nr:sigma-70 family RNA polymerase sigma factor [Pelagihabitans pacificus]NHF60382.1 sigma-70 family RNA polymerase sigma factor [Pelagihabitans pacificus]